MRKGQADRFVIDLTENFNTTSDLRRHLETHPSSRIREVLTVKGEVVERAWP
jgi:hypothetical protein